VTVAVVLMMLLVSEANEVKGVKEPATKQDTSKDEHLLKENSSKEVAAEKKAAEQASAGKDEKKPQEETSDAKDGASSAFVASGSASSSSPPADVQELPPPGKQKTTESNENNQKEDSAPGNVVSSNYQPKTTKSEETNNGEDKKVASQEKAAKVADPAQETKAVESDISKKEEDVMDVKTPEVKEESKVDTPLETSFEKQMGSGVADPPQSNFFSYFIVLAIITIIAYLVFHNKKKIVGLIVEGRSGRQAGRRRSGGREYRKLDSNVEDMMETGRETSMRQVIY